MQHRIQRLMALIEEQLSMQGFTSVYPEIRFVFSCLSTPYRSKLAYSGIGYAFPKWSSELCHFPGVVLHSLYESRIYKCLGFVNNEWIWLKFKKKQNYTQSSRSFFNLFSFLQNRALNLFFCALSIRLLWGDISKC